jgi:hypothetical protein
MRDKIYFWQEDIWDNLTNASIRKLNGSVFLFSGLAGSGKMDFALQYSKWLLCEGIELDKEISKKPCGTCQACKWFDAGSHPDFFDVSKAGLELEGSKSKKAKSSLTQAGIKIDQVRMLNGFLVLHKTLSRPKVIIINKADTLTPAVANALLKPLEDYPVYVLLLADNLAYVLPTVRSRSMSFNFRSDYDSKMQAWLLDQINSSDFKNIDNMGFFWNISGRAPLSFIGAYNSGGFDQQSWLVNKLLEVINNNFDVWEIINKWLTESLPLSWVLDAMYFILLDILKIYSFGSNKNITSCLYNTGFENLILSAAQKCDFTCVNRMIKKVEGFKSGVLNPASIHDDLMIEGVLIDWSFVLLKQEVL